MAKSKIREPLLCSMEPHKRCYRTRAQAEAIARQSGMRAYWHECGSYHLTSQGGSHR